MTAYWLNVYEQTFNISRVLGMVWMVLFLILLVPILIDSMEGISIDKRFLKIILAITFFFLLLAVFMPKPSLYDSHRIERENCR